MVVGPAQPMKMKGIFFFFQKDPDNVVYEN